MTSLWSHLFENYLTMLLVAAAALNTIITVIVIHWGATRKSERDKARIKARQGIEALLTLLDDQSRFPYEDGRSFERQKKSAISAAIAKKGIIVPRDPKQVIQRLREKDMKFGDRLEQIIKELEETDLI